MKNTYIIPAEAMLTPKELNDLFDYSIDYFVYAEMLFAATIEEENGVLISDAALHSIARRMQEAKDVIVPLLEKCGMKGRRVTV